MNFHVLLVIYYLFIIFWNGHSAALLYSDLHGVKMEINDTEFNLKKHDPTICGTSIVFACTDKVSSIVQIKYKLKVMSSNAILI